MKVRELVKALLSQDQECEAVVSEEVAGRYWFWPAGPPRIQTETVQIDVYSQRSAPEQVVVLG